MSSDPREDGPGRPKQSWFPTTQWTVVVNAGRGGGSGSARALARLCEAYWFPLYSFVRRSGYDAADAEDLTQEFFARLLEKHYLAAADPQRGKFRCFLLASLKHFLANEWNRAHARKRGGPQGVIPIDFRDAEDRYSTQSADTLTPERMFERRWALALLERVLGRLREEMAGEGKTALFERLKGILAGQHDPQSYGEIAEELGTTEGAIKVVVHRLRRRYRELLKAEIAETVAGPDELEDELRQLFIAVGRDNR
jgi:RNA polymerase sigma factor (sigma-70 family)